MTYMQEWYAEALQAANSQSLALAVIVVGIYFLKKRPQAPTKGKKKK